MIIIALVLKILSQKETNNFVQGNTSVENSNVDKNRREEHKNSKENVNEHIDRDLSFLDCGFPEDNEDNNEDFMITSEL